MFVAHCHNLKMISYDNYAKKSSYILKAFYKSLLLYALVFFLVTPPPSKPEYVLYGSPLTLKQ